VTPRHSGRNVSGWLESGTTYAPKETAQKQRLVDEEDAKRLR